MSKELISVIDIAKELGKSKQTIFKILKRMDIDPQKIRAPESHGQLISYISTEQAIEVKNQFKLSSDIENDESHYSEKGLFYLIQLEPEYDPGRFKLGYTTNIAERIRSHKCSAPFSILIKTWPSKQLWEKTAIESVTANCEKLHTEVFRTELLSDIEKRCNDFFH